MSRFGRRLQRIKGVPIQWSERRVNLSDCVEQKNRAKIGNAWEKKYAKFESYDGMPERVTSLYYWQWNQLSMDLVV
jgi:hypothetical protein